MSDRTEKKSAEATLAARYDVTVLWRGWLDCCLDLDDHVRVDVEAVEEAVNGWEEGNRVLDPAQKHTFRACVLHKCDTPKHRDSASGVL